MNKQLLFYLWGLLLTISMNRLSAQDTGPVTIYIYHDINNNGEKDSDEEYLSGFSLEVTDTEGAEVVFTEENPGIFKGNITSRSRVVVRGYDETYKTGNAAGAGSASVFFVEPQSSASQYYVAVSSGIRTDMGEQTIIVPSFEGGPADNPQRRDRPGLFQFGYHDDGIIKSLGGDAPDPKILTYLHETGATWGVATQTVNQKAYTSAIVKRHVGLGPEGTGGLYQYDLETDELRSYDLHGMQDVNGHTLDFGRVNRKTVHGEIAHNGADDNALTTKDSTATYDIDAFAKVAKSGIGSIAVTDDESELWLVNLYDRSLISVNVSGDEPDFTSIRRFPIMDMSGLPDTDYEFVKNINTGAPDIPYGAASFVDHHRVSWERNRFHSGGEGIVTDVVNIGNVMNSGDRTSEKQLYQTARIGENFSYNIPVPVSGTFKVRLHFAEIQSKYRPQSGSDPVERKFAVLAEGEPLLQSFNIVDNASGMYNAITREFSVEVTDGVLNLDFEGEGGEPALVSGIEVIGPPGVKIKSGELRPWGLTFHEGRGYLGMVADASESKVKDHLYAYIMSFDPENPEAGLDSVLSFSLQYPRELTSHSNRKHSYPLRTSIWEAWVDRYEDTDLPVGEEGDTLYLAYPQPIVSAIDFDTEGNMIIGLMDRWAHQGGFMNYAPVTGSRAFQVIYSAGDILKAFKSEDGFDLEKENNDNIAYYRNDDGPSFDGEFFYDDYFEAKRIHHGETLTGGMGVLKGSDEVVVTVYNPILIEEDTEHFIFFGGYTQGTHVYSTRSGSKQRANLFTEQFHFGKANGLGDIAFGTRAAPVNIGDYVWCDLNGDGIQQAGETGIPDVLLTLWEAGGTEPLDSTRTGADGLYIFEGINPNREYVIKIEKDQPALGEYPREASPAFAGEDPLVNSVGLDDEEVGYVIAKVSGTGMEYNYSYDFGFLPPEFQEVTRVECVDEGSDLAVFDMCEIMNAIDTSGNSIVEFYFSEEDAASGTNRIELTDECYYSSAGETLVAKVYPEGEGSCYSLTEVVLETVAAETDIQIQAEICPGEAVDFDRLIRLNQTGLEVYTDPARTEESRITDLQSFVPESLPLVFYFTAIGAGECNAYGSLLLNAIPSFEVELEDYATICAGEDFYFDVLDVHFPGGTGAVDRAYWTTNGSGRFYSGNTLSQVKYYRPSEQDIERRYILFYLNVENACGAERIEVQVTIRTEHDFRIECPPTDTVYCNDERVADPYHPLFPKPSAMQGCEYLTHPRLMTVDLEEEDCEEEGEVTAKIIRHWVFEIRNYPDLYCSDTIVVLRLPEEEVICPDTLVTLECGRIWKWDENGNPHPDVTGIPYYGSTKMWPNMDTTLCGIYAEYEDIEELEECGNTRTFYRVWTYYDVCNRQFDDCCNEILQQCVQCIVIEDTRAPIVRNNYKAYHQYVEDTVFINTEGNDCGGLFYPSVWVKDLCSDIDRVVARVRGFGDVELVRTDSVTFTAEKPIEISFGYDPVQVVYEAEDGCGNMGTFTHYVKVVDKTPPTVAANHDLNFKLQGKKGWMRAIDLDQGSYDNCGDITILARRLDWDEFCVDLCPEEMSTITTLEELNKIDPLSVLNSGEVELYYKKMIERFQEGGECENLLADAWIQDIRTYWAQQCGPKDEEGKPLIDVPGTFLGGGWSDKIPFGCEDACGPVEVELLVMDQWCNWGTSIVTVYVEDDNRISNIQALDDISISCDAYDKYYKSVLDMALESGDSDSDPLVFRHLDNLLGGYTLAERDNQGRAVDDEGNLLPQYFNVLNTVCKDTMREIRYQETDATGESVWKSKEVASVYLADESVKFRRGYSGVNCSGEVRQEIRSDIDECGVGTITRYFHVTAGCAENSAVKTYKQTIYINASCPLQKEMFDWPENVTICFPLNLDRNGNVELPLTAVGEPQYSFNGGCRMFTTSYSDEVADYKVSGKDLYKIRRRYKITDWCSGATAEHEQVIKLVNTCDDGDGSILTLSGTVRDPKNNFIPSVMLNTYSEDQSENSYSVNQGYYFLNLPHDIRRISLDKKDSYSNGLSTLDLILIEKYLKDPSAFDNPYQKIAADVNNNGVVDPMDLIAIRDVVIGKRPELVDVPAWRFVRTDNNKSYADVLPEDSFLENEWIGVKMGDVNFDADYVIRSRTDRGRGNQYPVTVHMRTTDEGESYLEVRIARKTDLAGMQISLDMSAYDDWSPDAMPSWLTEDMWHRKGDAFTFSWHSRSDFTRFEKDEVLITFRVGKDMQQEKALLNMNFSSEVYLPDLQVLPVQLLYGQSSGTWSHKVYPNPSSDYQIFEIVSPEEKPAKISVYSIDGKKIEEWDVVLSAGRSKISRSLSDRYRSGVYVYHILSEDQQMTGRFEIVR